MIRGGRGKKKVVVLSSVSSFFFCPFLSFVDRVLRGGEGEVVRVLTCRRG